MNVKLVLLGVVTFVMFHANAQLKIGDQPTIQDKSVALDVKGSNGRQGLWLPRVSDTSITGIRALNPPNGLVIYHTLSGKLLLRSNNAWVVFLETAIASITAGGAPMSGTALTFNTGTSGTDFNISSLGNTATWNLPDASATARGLVNTSSQAFLGIKTFNTGVTVLGATASTSNLTLGITSATTAAAQTTKYLSVDVTGKVTLNALNSINSVTAGGSLMTGPDLVYTTSASGTDFSISTTGNTATWNLPDASVTNRGAVTNAAQTFGGLKTFGNGVIVNNGSVLNNGTTANNGLTVSGATTSTSNLTLGITSATTAAVQTTKYLSVDATGKVTLNALNSINTVTAGGTLMTGPDLIYNTSTSGTDFSISTVGSTATWNLPDASATARGVINTSSQAFLGIKTFNTGVSVLGATASSSNLTLGLTSATAAAAQTTKYLSVDATGKVTLNALNTLTSVTAGGTTMTGPALTYLTSSTGTDFSISGSGNTATWNLPDASATARGVVNTGAQIFAGIKTFAAGAIVSGATGATSNLTLGINSATTPAAQTTKYLSLDATGNVTLNAMNSITSVTAGGPAMTGPALTYNTANSGTDFSITSAGNTATWNLPDASTTNRGVVTTAAQTLGGLKTLANGVVVNNGSALNNGTTANGGLSVTGGTTYTSELTLGLTSATAPGLNTDKYLSVNATGKVTLNTVNVTSNTPVKIKAYHVELLEAPVWLRVGTPQIFTFVIPGASLSLNSSVSISPYKQLLATTKINWVRILNATTIQVAMSAEGSDQKLNPGIGNEADFFVTVMEF